MVAIASFPTSPAPLRRPRDRDRRRPLVAVADPPRGRTVGRRGLATVVLGAVGVFAATSLALSPPVDATGAPASAGTYVASEGDSMWSIAREQAPAGEAAGYVEHLVEVNGGAHVVAGQVVTLPLP